jgi:hypothetical protein
VASEDEKLVIAIDFDDTFTAAPVLWASFIKAAVLDGHRIYCVTARRDTDENREILESKFNEHSVDIPIVFSNLGSKLWTMAQRGIKVNIWIDDAPHALVHGH